MTINHTPGPWSTEYDGSIVMRDQIVSSPIAPDGATKEERRANAQLIAAAPELLDALRKIAFECASYNDCWETAQAAIAKATWSAS